MKAGVMTPAPSRCYSPAMGLRRACTAAAPGRPPPSGPWRAPASALRANRVPCVRCWPPGASTPRRASEFGPLRRRGPRERDCSPRPLPFPGWSEGTTHGESAPPFRPCPGCRAGGSSDRGSSRSSIASARHSRRRYVDQYQECLGWYVDRNEAHVRHVRPRLVPLDRLRNLRRGRLEYDRRVDVGEPEAQTVILKRDVRGCADVVTVAEEGKRRSY